MVTHFRTVRSKRWLEKRALCRGAKKTQGVTSSLAGFNQLRGEWVRCFIDDAVLEFVSDVL